jgi:hypothetical protein
MHTILRITTRNYNFSKKKNLHQTQPLSKIIIFPSRTYLHIYNPPVGRAPSTLVNPATKTHFWFTYPAKQPFWLSTVTRRPRNSYKIKIPTSAGWPAAPLPGHHQGCIVATTLTLNRSAHKKTRRALSPSSPPFKANQSPDDSLRAWKRSFWKQAFRIATALTRALKARLIR